MQLLNFVMQRMAAHFWFLFEAFACFCLEPFIVFVETFLVLFQAFVLFLFEAFFFFEAFCFL